MSFFNNPASVLRGVCPFNTIIPNLTSPLFIELIVSTKSERWVVMHTLLCVSPSQNAMEVVIVC